MWKKEKGESRGGSWDDAMTQDAGEAMAGGGDQSQTVNAFVGKGVEFKGVISYDGTVRIDGQVEGEIHTEGTLLIGEDAVITATVTAGTIICKGKIMGDIQAKEKIKLRAPAVVNGSVTTPMLSMEEGVLFNGKCEMSLGSVPEHREKVLHVSGPQASGLKRTAG